MMSYDCHFPGARLALTNGGNCPYTDAAWPSGYVSLWYESSTCTSYRPIRNTPLLPRSWLSPFGGVGSRNSMCSCTSPKACFVAMAPVPATTSMAPSTIFQRAGFVALSADVHCASDVAPRPSNNTMASDGGGPEGR